jgi:hypothetical protein
VTGTHLLVVCASDDNLFDENVKVLNKSEDVLDSPKEVYSRN